VTNDPTTKPCPAGRIYSLRMTGEHVYTHNPDCECHGTGRVPMDTRELLEALFALGWDVNIYRTAYGVRVDIDNGSDYLTPSGKFNTPDEALSAALREVTP